MADPHVRYVDVDGGRIAVEVAGEGHPLVLLHAGIADRRMWDDQVGELAASYQVVRLDFRGFGDSSPPSGAFAHHADVAAVLDWLGMAGAFVVGASMGGGVAVDLAIDHPRLVGALVLVGSALSGDPFTDPATRAGWRAVEERVEQGDLRGAADLEIEMWAAGPRRRLEDVDPQVRARLQQMLVPTYGVAESDDEWELDPPAAQRLSEVVAPTLVVVGGLDRPDILRKADLLASGIPGARLVRVDGVAHLPSMERTDEFTRIIVTFLTGLGDRAAR